MNLSDTEAWDERFNLPTFRGMNPHAFTAYCSKLSGEDFSGYVPFLDSCRVSDGLFMRYPDGSSGETSWDEVIGMAYMGKEIANEIYTQTDATDGIYNPLSPDDGTEKQNLYRFPFMRPLLRLAAGKTLSLIDQGILALWMIWDGINPDKGMSGHLQVWLYSDRMRTPLLSLGASIWRFVMRRRGITVYKMFSGYFWAYPRFLEYLRGAL